MPKVYPALFRSGRREQAFEHASSMIQQGDAALQLIFAASKILTDAARELPRAQSERLYEQVASALRSALQKLGAPPLPSLVLAARLNLAIALERLGRDAEAQRAYAELVLHHPESDEAPLARALFLLPRDRAQAAHDLRTFIATSGMMLRVLSSSEFEMRRRRRTVLASKIAHNPYCSHLRSWVQ